MEEKWHDLYIMPNGFMPTDEIHLKSSFYTEGQQFQLWITKAYWKVTTLADLNGSRCIMTENDQSVFLVKLGWNSLITVFVTVTTTTTATRKINQAHPFGQVSNGWISRNSTVSCLWLPAHNSKHLFNLAHALQPKHNNNSKLAAKKSHFVCLLAIIHRLLRLVQLMAPKITHFFFSSILFLNYDRNERVSLDFHINKMYQFTRNTHNNSFRGFIRNRVFRMLFKCFCVCERKYTWTFYWTWLINILCHNDALMSLLFWFRFVRFSRLHYYFFILSVVFFTLAWWSIHSSHFEVWLVISFFRQKKLHFDSKNVSDFFLNI